MIMNSEPESMRRALLSRGIDVSEIRRSANNEFVWFHDPDGNRFELSRPLPGHTESAVVAHELRAER